MTAHNDLKWLALAALLALSASAQAARTLVVDADDAQAYPTIQGAIDAAADGDTVVIRDGVYTPQPPAIEFKGKAVTVRSENGPANCIVHAAFIFNQWETTGSVLSGVTISEVASSSRGGGIYCRNASPQVINCIIENCQAQRGGGGAYCFAGRPTFSDCIFRANSATTYMVCDDEGCWTEFSSGGAILSDGADLVLIRCVFQENTAGRGGGAIYHGMEGRMTVRDCTFLANSARYGGACRIDSTQDALLEDCVFADNQGADDGGALYLADADIHIAGCLFEQNRANLDDGGAVFMINQSAPKITACRFRANHANEDGGAMALFESAPEITECVFEQNTAQEDGGAMYNFVSSRPVISRCRFTGNSAVDDGGAISNRDGSEPLMMRCLFEANTARDNGGAIFNRNFSGGRLSDCIFLQNIARTAGGALYNRDNCNPVLYNCLLVANIANDSGGAVYNRDNCNPEISFCTLVDNTATFDGGGVCSLDDCYPHVYRSILWNNDDDGGTDESAQLYGRGEVRNSCVKGWTGTLLSDGQYSAVIGADPLFIKGPRGDYYLSQVEAGQAQTSPCVNYSDVDITATELTGYTTRIDHVADGALADIGYHYRPEMPGDINHDGQVNLIDFAVVASQWHGGAAVLTADIAPAPQDGQVDLQDLGAFAELWLR